MEPKKILIIEDEAALLYAFKARLTVEGLNVLTASTAEEGFEIIKKEKPKLILLDLILPQMDGFSLLKKIKADRNFSQVPVIIISNLSKKENMEKSLNLGAQDYIVKSEFNLDTLIAKVKEVADHV
ncbi:MAG: response regulator [Patescibacteria group bacterium]